MKRSLILDGDVDPLGAVISGKKVHNSKLLEAAIEAIVVDRPKPTKEKPQHLCLDKGFDNPAGRSAAAAKGHTPHIRRIGEEKAATRGRKSTSRGVGWWIERIDFSTYDG